MARALERLGYVREGQTGSHLKLATDAGGRSVVIVPMHRAVPVGTLHRILRDVARHHGVTLAELVVRLGL